MADRATTFDPYALVGALERRRVSYVVVGALARVIRGTDEITDGLDITPSWRNDNLPRLARALADVEARRLDGRPLSLDSLGEPIVSLATTSGELRLVPQPAGTRGFDDLRRSATREPLGEGLRPRVASTGDLARMLGALDQPNRLPTLLRLRRLIELERSLGLGLGR